MQVRNINAVIYRPLVIFFILFSFVVDAVAVEKRFLFSEEDAANYSLTDKQLQQAKSELFPSQESYGFVAPCKCCFDEGGRVEGMGPGIKINNLSIDPDARKCEVSFQKNAVAFSMKFLKDPRTVQQIDMDSFKLEVKWGFIWKDITKKEEVQNYLSLTNHELSATNVPIPSGKYRLKVSIADTAGELTYSQFLLYVSN